MAFLGIVIPKIPILQIINEIQILMMIRRAIEKSVMRRVDFKKAIIITGPRQSGKTTFLRAVAESIDPNYQYINGDDPAVRTLWDNPSQALLRQILGNHKVILIDEAQRLFNIGLSTKMIVDSGDKIQLFISGSSSLELSDAITEPLTGRKWEYTLLPFSWNELKEHYSFLEVHNRLEQFLVTGMYPEVIMNPENAHGLLISISGSYLYKDILEMGGIRRPEILVKLLQALAWQVGSEVSYSELAQTVGADKATVSSYIDLLEKSYVVFRLHPFARNLRNEINTSRKIYFYDNGIRNAIINNLASVPLRNDIGILWENFLMSERMKKIAYTSMRERSYFWRNTNQAEIDYVEEVDGVISAFEFKWNPKTKVRFPKAFVDAYHPQNTEVIHRDNYWAWLQ